MEELLTDQQQAEVVRRWLRENGPFLLGGVVLGLAGLFGWSQWQDYRSGQAEQASALYEQLLDAARSQRPVRAAELERDLAADYAGTPYLDQARLVLAKLHMDRNEAEEAASYLAQVVAAPGSDAVERIARLRLARVRLQQEQYDAALAALAEIDENSAFAPRYHEVRGDVYAASSQAEAARVEYESALGAMEQQGVIDRAYVQAKLDAVGGPTVAESLPESPAPDVADLPAAPPAD